MKKMSLKIGGAALSCLLLTGPALAEGPEDRGETNIREEATEGNHLTLFSGEKAITLWGSVEFNGGYTTTDNDDDESGFEVDATLGFDAALTKDIAATVILLHEDDGTPIDTDEAYITYTTSTKLIVSGGKMYLPFGNFNSSMISDPLTLDLGETNKTALQTSWANNLLEVKLGLFNGDRDISGDYDLIDNLVASIQITPVETITVGFSYICDLAETNLGLINNITASYDDNVRAFSAFVSAELGPVTLDAEYVGALDDFSASTMVDPDRAEELTGAQPAAYFIEVGVSPMEKVSVAIRAEAGIDFADDLKRFGGTVSYELAEETTVSAEYLYTDLDGDAAHSISAQLAVEF
ncbi:MAG: LbtU family siderophore porin [Proteobacteria bacterium]|nr:LbtU family siderophore porin [Pseudomonadota bacterium]MBU1687493.1 LbtU family siderophore porin [Pseudomonadota bacterium]